MSHFTVLVIGEDVEEQLAPFHEFECTGQNDQYIQDVDVTAESIDYGTDKDTGAFDLEAALAYHGLEDKIVSDESEVDRDGDHKYGYAIVQDNQLIKAVNRTNPNAQWDWYSIGGRWTGFFKLKDGANGELGRPGVFGNKAPAGTADSALKRDIDFDGMRHEAGEAAGKKWDLAHSLMGDSINDFIPWPEVRDNKFPDNIEKARNFYHDQAAVKALRKDKDLTWYSVEDFKCPRVEYVLRARNAAVTTFALIKDGQWHERGSMGRWGMVSNEMDVDAWHAEFATLLDSLPDDTLLTVVDCHS